MALFGGGLARRDAPQEAVVDVEDAPPRDGGRVDVEPDKLGPLLLGEQLRVGKLALVDPELLQPPEHDGGKGPLSRLVVHGAEPAEECRVGLRRLEFV